MYSVALYQKYLTRLGEMIIFEPRFENYHFSQLHEIFLIYSNTICVFSIFMFLLPRLIARASQPDGNNYDVIHLTFLAIDAIL